MADAAPDDAESADASGASGPEAGPPADGGSDAGSRARERLLNIVAHPDDDLGMMNPDLLQAMARRAALETVFLTAGNSGFGCVDYPIAREAGLKAAYAEMAMRPNQWSEAQLELAQHHVRRLTLEGAAVQLTFVGLSNDPQRELRSLWQGDLERITTWAGDPRRPLESYSREELVALLLALIDAFAPTQVNINDASLLYPQSWPFDHPEHAHAGLFSLLALERYAGHPLLRMYRAYNIQFEPENLAGEDAARSWHVFETYAAHDPKICRDVATTICGALTDCANPSVYYEPMRGRRYAIDVLGGSGVLRAPDGRCLAPDGSAIRMAECGAQPPGWRVEADDSVRDLAAELCMTASGQADAPVTLSACDGGPEQRFRLTDVGQLRGPGARCVEQVNEALRLVPCADRPTQRSFVLSRE